MADGENRIGFAAQERDEESRYFAMGARQYDCLSGRFLSLDPLMDKFPEQSPYSYANNNPISFKDPSGLEPEGEKGRDEVQVYQGMSPEEFDAMYRELLAMNEEMANVRKGLENMLGLTDDDPFELPIGKFKFYKAYRGDGGGDGSNANGRICRDIRSGKGGTYTNSNGIITYTQNVKGLGVITITVDANKLSTTGNGDANPYKMIDDTKQALIDVLENDETGLAVGAISSKGGININLSLTGQEISDCFRNGYGNGCKNGSSDPTPGLANFTYKYSSSNGNSTSCYAGLESNTIYLAMEVAINGNADRLGYFNSIDEYTHPENRLLWHVFGHEMGHMIDAMICGINLTNKEDFAEGFLGYLIKSQSLGLKTYKGKIHEK